MFANDMVTLTGKRLHALAQSSEHIKTIQVEHVDLWLSHKSFVVSLLNIYTFQWPITTNQSRLELSNTNVQTINEPWPNFVPFMPWMIFQSTSRALPLLLPAPLLPFRKNPWIKQLKKLHPKQAKTNNKKCLKGLKGPKARKLRRKRKQKLFQ